MFRIRGWLLRKCNDTVTIACAVFEIISRGEQLTQAKGEYETGTGKERAQERDRRLSAERDVAIRRAISGRYGLAVATANGRVVWM